MNKKLSLIFIGLLIGIMLIGLASAKLGEVKQGQCINLKVLSNCTSVDIISVENVGTGNEWVLNTAMQNLGGQTFNYSFCNTATLGVYNFNWDENCLDCSGGLCGNNFEVKANVDNLDSNPNFPIYMILIFSICIFAYLKVSKMLGTLGIFLMGFGILFKEPTAGWMAWIIIGIGLLGLVLTLMSSPTKVVRRRRF